MKQPLNLTAELVPLAYVEALLELAQTFGDNREALFAAAQVKPQVLQHPNGRVSFFDFSLLASAALQACQEPALGLLLGQRLNVSSHGILGYAVLASANLGQAIQFALKYYRVLGLAFDLELIEHPECLELRAIESMPMGPLARFAAEGLLASLYSIARFLLGTDLQGLAVGFAHAAPSYAERYREIFGVAALFEQPWHSLSMPKRYLTQPMALANPGTVQMCEQQCEAPLSTLGGQVGLLCREAAHQRQHFLGGKKNGIAAAWRHLVFKVGNLLAGVFAKAVGEVLMVDKHGA